MPENPIQYLSLAVCLGIPLIAGAVSGIATSGRVNTWYATLAKPSFNPPHQVFAPVWTSLYILMGISLYLVWRAPAGPERNVALLAFGVQLVLNFAWSFVFFHYRRISLAFGEIILLWISVLSMVVLFHRVDTLAAWLQLPYLVWVAFAILLNGAIRARNTER